MAQQVGLSPISLARADAMALDAPDAATRQRIDRASTVDMLVTVGLSGSC